MPKDYRERIIDERPPRVITAHAVRSTTGVDPEEPLPDGMFSTVISLEPGDGVLWFLRLATADSSPTGRMVSIVTTAGDAVSHTYVDEPSGWVNYIYSAYGDFAFDSEGTTIQNDTIYAIWDQFDGFTAGDYRLSWDIPATDRANVEGAIHLRGVDLTAQGNFYDGQFESPTWEKYVVGSGGSYNNFPVSVPTANHSLVYGIWYMSLSIQQPAGFASVPGATHLTYTYTDPADPPALNQTVVSRIGAATGSSLTSGTPTTGTATGSPGGTSYYLAAIVLHSATGITYTTVEMEA